MSLDMKFHAYYSETNCVEILSNVIAKNKKKPYEGRAITMSTTQELQSTHNGRRSIMRVMRWLPTHTRYKHYRHHHSTDIPLEYRVSCLYFFLGNLKAPTVCVHMTVI